jgi:predicted transcriptional regulator
MSTIPHQPPWPLEELVQAQCMECEGRSYDEIAQALGRSSEEVRRRLDADPPPKRAPEFAGVAYRHLKGR